MAFWGCLRGSADKLALLFPLGGKRLHEPRQGQLSSLLPVEDRLDDVWRKEREPLDTDKAGS